MCVIDKQNLLSKHLIALCNENSSQSYTLCTVIKVYV